MSDSLGLLRPVGQFQLAPLALTYLRKLLIQLPTPSQSTLSTPASTSEVSLSERATLLTCPRSVSTFQPEVTAVLFLFLPLLAL